MNNKRPREERLSLKASRDKQFDKFRRNLRILRASVDCSGVELAGKIPLKNGARCVDLEYGRGNPTTEELMLISKYFNFTIDDLLHKEAQISFKS